MEARDSFCFPKKTKNPNPSPIGKKFGFCCRGAPPGTRTLGPLIKSQLLYQLSQRCILSECGFFILITQVGDYLFSRAVSSELSSAQVSLTSVFGMGTGGTSPSLTPTDLTGSVYHNWSTLSSVSQKDVPSKLNNHCLHFFVDSQSLKRIVVKPSTYQYTLAEWIAPLTHRAYQPCSLQGVLLV